MGAPSRAVGWPERPAMSFAMLTRKACFFFRAVDPDPYSFSLLDPDPEIEKYDRKTKFGPSPWFFT